jgi:hypothetical protein
MLSGAIGYQQNTKESDPEIILLKRAKYYITFLQGH